MMNFSLAHNEMRKIKTNLGDFHKANLTQCLGLFLMITSFLYLKILKCPFFSESMLIKGSFFNMAKLIAVTLDRVVKKKKKLIAS